MLTGRGVLTGSAWGQDDWGEECEGCGPQYELRNCADISVTPGQAATGGYHRQGDRETDRQADRQTDRQADGKTGRQADRETGRQAGRREDR